MTIHKYAISDENKQMVADSLKKLLADSYTLYLQSHNFHWNVTGPRFRDLHLMFEEHYTELATAVDEIAERIRTLNSPAPGTYKEFANLSSIKEVDGTPSAEQMVKILAESHNQVIYTCREVLDKAQQAGDESSAGLASDRMRIHEKTAWMLRSLQE